ncbi:MULTISPECIES: DNA repair protein RecO C-terminal domain-containing protein [unclassified Psychrobacter]|uniref:DNA repair protein RecO n=1 Tax=unclassified Psychrobacter TaxID=196806 RepID=UPI0025B51F37|nr:MULTISPECIES: DNA repair protein RecO C-terminal domain-containing protein [unclassified Psychrobacter]MDN3452307.1 DNA repair protein RecO C-terminal domain-containing protein [Psychrobacter sp. APC 3350]MDN3502771.1 DNA repair protein RecO C-terminal domain-containing protein [Psychrobacter sp. 5A.1]
MRNEALVGYLLHQRPYQEKRALYYLFSQQHGVIHGVGKKGAPLFMPLQLFATGKRDLKTFSQINIASQTAIQTDNVQEDSPSTVLEAVLPYGNISGQHQYAALYINEILWRLLPTDDPMPILWQHYQISLQQLKQPLTSHELRLCLRQFEQYLFTELGFTLSLTHDNVENPIETNGVYRFLPDVGLLPIVQHSTESEHLDSTSGQTVFKGADIIEMAHLGITEMTLNHWSKLHRHLIDHLLDYQPLQSRLLWLQQQRYQ